MSREAFESEARKHGFILDRLDKSGVYVQLITEQAWSMWQAASVVALARADDLCEEFSKQAIEDYKNTGNAYFTGQVDAANELSELIRALKDES